MSFHKTERLIDLIALLLSSKVPVTRARIKKLRPEYQNANEATFDRVFARDKKELLAIGVPVKLYHLESRREITTPAQAAQCQADEIGYLIDQQEYFMPQLDLEHDDWLVLKAVGSQTARAGDSPELAAVWRKLECQLPADVKKSSPEVFRLAGGRQDARADLKHLPRLLDAVREHRLVEFTYHAINSGQEARRNVKPYFLVYHSGVWYLLAFCTLRRELRVFKVSRMGKLRIAGGKGSFKVPDDIDPHDHIGPKAWELPGGSDIMAELAVAPEQAWIVRSELGEKAVWEGDGKVAVRVRNQEPFVRWAAANCDRVRITSPAELARMAESQLNETLKIYQSR